MSLPCLAAGCSRPAKVRGFCKPHYDRLLRQGRLERRQLSRPEGPCEVEDCDRPVSARNLCMKHYRRWKRTGDPLCCRPPGQPKGHKMLLKPRVYIASNLKHYEAWLRLPLEWPQVEWTAFWPQIADQQMRQHGKFMEGDLRQMRSIWLKDTGDVKHANAVFVFGQGKESLRGALFEAGFGYALGKTIYCVGEANFGTWPSLPGVHMAPSIGDAVEHLTGQG